MSKTGRICILSGGVHTGKTTFLREICRRWQARAVKINGVLSPAYFINDNRLGYNALTLPNGEEFPLLRTATKSPGQQAGRYFFLPQSLEKTKKAILNFKESDITVIDEIGPAELKNQGYWDPLLILLEHAQPVLVVIRKELVSSLSAKIGLSAFLVSLSSSSPDAMLQKWLSKQKKETG